MPYRYFTFTCVAAVLSLCAPGGAKAESSWRAEGTGSIWQVESTTPSWRIERASSWRVPDTRAAALKWEIGYLTLSAIDAVQTIECLNRQACEEVNPLFGKRPSTKTIIITKAAGGLAHFAVFSYLNNRDPKLALRGAQISFALQGSVVLLNTRVSF